MTLLRMLPLLLLACAAAAQEGPAPWVRPTRPGHFLDPKANGLVGLLPPPPVRDSLEERAELETLRQVQAWRSPEQEAWAREIEDDTVWKAGKLLGAWFRAENLPRTARFFWKLTVDVHALSEGLKRCHDRPRPPHVDPEIRPCVSLPSNTSYPSGHALQAFVRARVLAEMFPAHREALLQRAHRAAWARILGGVHWPSDDIGAQRVARDLARRLKANPRFLRDLRACRREVAAFQACHPAN